MHADEFAVPLDRADSVEALGGEGTLVTPGAVGNPMVTFNLWSLLGKRARIQGTGSAQASRARLNVFISLFPPARRSHQQFPTIWRSVRDRFPR